MRGLFVGRRPVIEASRLRCWWLRGPAAAQSVDGRVARLGETAEARVARLPRRAVMVEM